MTITYGEGTAGVAITVRFCLFDFVGPFIFAFSLPTLWRFGFLADSSVCLDCASLTVRIWPPIWMRGIGRPFSAFSGLAPKFV